MVDLLARDKRSLWRMLNRLYSPRDSHQQKQAPVLSIGEALSVKLEMLQIELSERLVVKSLAQFLWEENMICTLKLHQDGLSSLQFLKEYYVDAGQLRVVGDKRFAFFSESAFGPLRLFTGLELKAFSSG